jgi:membrane associated rhomboid family serine protease
MRPQREKIFNIPGVVLVLVALLLGIHGLRQLLVPETDFTVLQRFAFVPARFTYAFDPERVSAAFNALESASEVRADALAAFLGDGSIQWWTPLTYAFLHGNWAHVGFNCLWFVAFGAAVARRFGVVRFLAFFCVTAVAGAALHYITHLADLAPVIGASAVVSATMAAVARFAFQGGPPFGDMPVDVGPDEAEAPFQPAAPPLRELLKDRRVLAFVGTWFLLNLIFGIVPLPTGLGDSTVAWEAHVGGFLAGFFLFPLFDPPASPPLPKRDRLT